MAADAPSPRPTAEEATASAENSEIQNDATKSAAVADKSDTADAVVADVGVGEKEKEAAGEPSKNDSDEKDEEKENAAATEPEADTEDVSALDGSTDVKKSKKKSPATTAKSTPKSAAKKKSLANLKSNGTPAKVKNADVNYEPGMQVLAKMRTFPPWPAVILSEELLPEALLKTRPSNKNPRTKGSSAEPAEVKRHWPVMYMGTNEYSWMNIANLDPLTAEILATPPTNIKSKGLLDAYQVAQEGFGLEQVKKLQASEVMDVDTAEEDAAEEDAAEEEAESMEVDEPESEADKKSKKAKKRKLSTSDEDPETSEKPAKTPKKAASKAKTPKTKTAKTPKTPANGTTAKAAAKPKASTAKKEKAAPAPKSAKKKTPARSSKAKSAEKVDESDSEREEASSEVTKEEEKDSAEFQMKQVKQLRGRLQRGFLTKDTPPSEKDMPDMASKFDLLEELQNKGIDAEVIKSTKINKVLKGIFKLPSVPLDDKYNFKKRSADLLQKMNVVLAADGATPATEKTLAVGKEKDIKKAAEKKNGVKADEADQDKEEEKSEEKADDKNDEDPATSKKEDVEMKDSDVKAADAEKEETAKEVPEKEAVEASN
ncbi:uncharacterized protein LAJ45_07690 [Morchella importuna]|uniref:uncharacterized protein n=1 Tax=Morchella importuna TaxID=1174673 RepID=UPI001E8D24CD|nr:uncharacterized protein LAJ45_07690 [Morchella importuna]KAH8148238.1 hypothetical protein LAJ45_07690 [Morchella importuna]